MIRCYVTDRRQGDVLKSAQAAVNDGIDFIQIREKDLPGRALFDLTCRIRDIAKGTATKVLVNDRLDVAMAAGVDGLHLPADGLPIAKAKPLIQLLGCSTHSRQEAIEAERAGADYVVFGPVFETPGKTAVGLEALKDVVSAVAIPVIAIGGVTRENTSAVLQTGAAGIAAIRLFQRD